MTETKRKRGRPATGRRPRTTFSLDAADLAAAKALADVRRCDVATVIREALAVYLATEKEVVA